MAVSILTTIMPPSAVIIIIGVLWKGAGKTGALWGLLSGFVTGCILIVLDVVGMLSCIAENTLYFRTFVTFLITLGVTVLVSVIKREQAPDMPVEIPEDSPPVRLVEKPGFWAVILVFGAVAMYVFLTIAF